MPLQPFKAWFSDVEKTFAFKKQKSDDFSFPKKMLFQLHA